MLLHLIRAQKILLDPSARTQTLGKTELTGGPSFSVQRRLKLKDTTTGGDEGWLELELAQLGLL